MNTMSDLKTCGISLTLKFSYVSFYTEYQHKLLSLSCFEINFMPDTKYFMMVGLESCIS